MIQLKLANYTKEDSITLSHLFQQNIETLQSLFLCNGKCPTCDGYQICRDFALANAYLKSIID